MFSKEQLERIKALAEGNSSFHSFTVLELIKHIAELEENATAQALALKAAKAMQQAETERADANERDAERYRWLRGNLGNTVSHWFCTEGGEELDDAIDQAMRHL